MPTVSGSRTLNGTEVSSIGFGCMSLSHAYATPPAAEAAIAVVRRALDLGVNHFDTAALYGFGRNESLIGEAIQSNRQHIFLASKCGMTGIEGKRVIDGRPQTLERTCHESLARLHTDVIDLYYLHRVDPNVPVEDSVGALAELVKKGHIRAIGLSEVSASTLRRAHRVHPIAAVQSEYSVWTRNPEVAVLEECQRLGAALVAFSPLTRGFLVSDLTAPLALEASDIRRSMPRFMEPQVTANRSLIKPFADLAQAAGCSRAQLALAWLLHKSPHVIPIPGTTSIQHLEDNVRASRIALSDDLMEKIESLVNPNRVQGARYNATTQLEIDTEEWAVP